MEILKLVFDPKTYMLLAIGGAALFAYATYCGTQWKWKK